MDGAAFNINDQILEGLRPNFFELLSVEAMHDALRPAFQYLIKVLVQSRPDWFQTLWRWSDEVYLMFETLLQIYFIRRYSGSFSECFYSLNRVPCGSPADSLKKLGKLASIVCLAGVPYIKVKLDWIFSKLQEADDAIPLRWDERGQWRSKVAYVYFNIHPYTRSLWELLKLVFRLRYLFNSSVFYSPLHVLAGVILQRSTAMETNDDTSNGNWLQWLAGNSFPLFVFSLKFVEWWYSAERREAVKMLTVLPVPPPPKRMKPHLAGVRLPADPSLCPLCGIHRTTPTALSSSGYVFCYMCIHGYIQEHGECPVTCLPSSLQQLVRLYPHQQ